MYKKYKDEDGMLYVTYSNINPFGGANSDNF
jgi:hypothetical protein